MQRPYFATPQEYGRHFTDVSYWRSYVEVVCARHRLAPCTTIRAGLPGTHPTFLVDERYVVKFYTHFFNGATDHAVEHEVYTLLAREPQLLAPALIASGDLFTTGDSWRWPYIVTTLVPGTSLIEVYDQVDHADRLVLATTLGPLLRRFHQLPLHGTHYLRRSWDGFVAFLARRRRACVAESTHRGSLPAHLTAQIDGYLPPLEALIDRSSMPLLLHCDLNADHILGQRVGGRWRVTGIIDFGDARVGDWAYELGALHLGLFRGDKHLLRAFLKSYGVATGPRDQFIRRAMSMALLHEFDVLSDIAPQIAAAQLSDLDELAMLLWDVDQPGLPGRAPA